jgi:8-oxo-dGTP diphosphatase
MVTMDSRVGSYVVVIEDNRVLLVRWVDGSVPEWTLPGGGIEFGETAETCAVREAREETGLDVVLDRLLGVHDRYIPLDQRLSAGSRPLHLHRVYYLGHVTAGDLTPSSDTGNDRAAWIPLADVPALVREQGVDVALGLAGCGPTTDALSRQVRSRE